MSLSEMYPAKNNSPKTSLSAAATASSTSITVSDASVFPDAPNLAVIGTEVDAEIIKYTSKSGNKLSGVTRGINGTTAKAWPVGTNIARNFTAYDHELFRNNILDLQTSKAHAVVETASGNPAILSDGSDAPLADLTVGIEPVQDLHGYDHPWPAGGGKNLWNPDWVINGVYPNATSIRPGTEGIHLSVYAPVVAGRTYTISKIVSSRFRYAFTANFPIVGEPVTGYVADNTASFLTFTVPEGMAYVVSYVGYADEGDVFADILASVMIEESSSATFYEPYENICPITGWMGCNITRGGKNYLETVPRIKETSAYTVVVDDDGFLTINGELASATVAIYNFADASATNSRQTDNKKHLPNGTYRKIPAGASKGWYIQVYGTNTENAGSSDVSSISGASANTFTIDDTYKYNFCRFYLYANVPFDNETIYPWICKGDEVVNYNVTFPSAVGTVYRGALDVTTGVLTVTHGKLEMQDLPAIAGQSGWLKSSQTGIMNAYYIGSSPMNRVTPKDSSFLCSHFEQKDTYVGIVNGLFHSNTGVFYIMCDEAICGNTVESFTQWLADQKTAGTPVELWYKLTTPVTYQLDPTEVMTLLGENTISADTGPVTLRYRADTKMYIDGKFAELQALILEN